MLNITVKYPYIYKLIFIKQNIGVGTLSSPAPPAILISPEATGWTEQVFLFKQWHQNIPQF